MGLLITNFPVAWIAALCFLSVNIGLWVFTAIRLLYFHPLSAYPGPRLAVVTKWYRGYYDVILKGRWLHHLENLHEIYGEIVRIGPNELHFSDPRAYAEIYATGSPFTKEPVLYRCFGMSDGSFAIVDPHKSKRRREMLLPLFSRRAILKLESVVQEKVATLVTQILAHDRTPVDLSLAFRCTTFDTITDYCFAHSFDSLHAPKFQHPLLIRMQASIQYFWLLRYFPFILPLALSIPEWIGERCNPLYKDFNAVRKRMEEQVDGVLKGREGWGMGMSTSMSAGETGLRETVYDHLVWRGEETDKSHRYTETLNRKDLVDEALVLLQAGSDTVGHTCIMGTFHALMNKKIYEKLVSELVEAWPDKTERMDYSKLEKLPYLTAFVKEALRISYGVITPLARVVPKETSITGCPIPAGTIVSSGSTFMHNNPNVFPDPFVFNPERWLVEDRRAKEMEGHFVPFSRGPRMCIGFNLAWCELYLVFANIFRKLDLEIHDTTEKDFEYKEIFVPIRQGKHLRAVISEKSA